jgi:hypothetical protein
MFGDYLRKFAEEGELISRDETVALVKRVEDFKIAADPHPRRTHLPAEEVEAIARSICDPLNSLVAWEMGRQRGPDLGPRFRAVSEEEITICLTKAVHHLVLSAATVSRRTKRELAQDLLESAGVMGRVAGLKRQAGLCGGDRVGPEDIVGTWIAMLVAAGCISADVGDPEPSTAIVTKRFRGALLDWYEKYSHRGVETLEADLEDSGSKITSRV